MLDRSRNALVSTLVILFLWILWSSCGGADSPRLVMISIDGLRPVEYTTPGPARIPVLRRLARDGVWADGVEGVLPTVTYPSHTTLVTGVPPAAHGITHNRIVDPEGRADGAWYWYARDIKVPTLASAARARGLSTAIVQWPVSVGLEVDDRVPEFWRSDHPESLSLLKALSRPEDLLDDAERARGAPLPWPLTDRARTDIAKHIVRRSRPVVMLVHLVELDSAQHRRGPGSREAAEALERIDGYVGEILDELRLANLLEGTHVAVVSDHGFLPIERVLQPNAIFRREGLLQVDARGRVVSWEAYFHSDGGSGFVFVRRPDDRALVARVRDLLERLRADPQAGVRTLWDRPALARLGAEPEAQFALDVRDGFYTGGGHDTPLAGTTSRGGHGFGPDRPEMRAAFILAGPGVSRRGSLGVVRMTQIAPTLADLLGVALSPQADQPLDVR
ncbi:MAG TPA: ectonucleotide pyrophosphatase/phosphodiesterase [Vicinamibacterales bacterium]|nr:ectonucleotide pyrophosphatase/phosphodiesterase [Vicinamibacterales bacterium]